ncbi:MAG: chromosome segregation protein SMC [Cyanophyceae cyanobacterium]
MFVKRVEISNFKSFGGTVAVPLLPGFTAISGPNGSGKSNILDALLFALGLSSSKGMRADRLPDLVNQSSVAAGANGKASRRSTVEATVTVTFDLTAEARAFATAIARSATDGSEGEEGSASGLSEADLGALPVVLNDEGQPQEELRVTRRLRVTPQGTYTSNYYLDDRPCTLTELHQQLNRLRIYPEGYNVVLQGDVTGIISMHPRERRQIIDELAGVANFDRKIEKARHTLEEVKEHEDRCHIVEQELKAQGERLDRDRAKALKYQALKGQLQEKLILEQVARWRVESAQAIALESEIAQEEEALTALAAAIAAGEATLAETIAQLDELNRTVKALGETEQLALQAELATQQATLEQRLKRLQELQEADRQALRDRAAIKTSRRELAQTRKQLAAQEPELHGAIAAARQTRDQAQANLENARQATAAIAGASQAFLEQQGQLRHQIDGLQGQLEPARAQQTQLQEREQQWAAQLAETVDQLTALHGDRAEKTSQLDQARSRLAPLETQVVTLAQAITTAEQELQLQEQTRDRLLEEQRQRQRQLDKLEAQLQAQRETQGTHAVQVLLSSGLSGLCGLVAELGRVDPPYQIALEVAAGGRLGYLVVEDDSVAAAAIALLKRERAGRVTLLPLNKIRGNGPSNLRSALQRGGPPDGWIDYATNLIEFDDRYRNIFEYVFGATVIFESLDQARPHLGKHRIVTLDGELLETSGAMTGGSLQRSRGGLHFGTASGPTDDHPALREHQNRLSELDRILGRCDGAIAQAKVDRQRHSQALDALRSQHRDAQRQVEQLETLLITTDRQIERLQQQRDRLATDLTACRDRLTQLEQTIPPLEGQRDRLLADLAHLEAAHDHSEWQTLQAQQRDRETALDQARLALQAAEQALTDLHTEREKLQDRDRQLQEQLSRADRDRQDRHTTLQTLDQEQTHLRQAIVQLQDQIAELETTLSERKAQRDRLELQRDQQQQRQQKQQFQQQTRQSQQQTRHTQLQTLRDRLTEQQTQLPDPLPELPSTLTADTLAAYLDQLQTETRSLQQRISALEPVNMLALDEYNRVQERLTDLSAKLATLEEERTELLLRVENFTTLRQQAFYEAYEAVDRNFRTIFAELSQGDGRLHLDDPEDPLNSGLNLIAHPKGKPVRRLASMSGGEKSLTALSFIFALQRYRPSPFYAFDEVDMFLDGANVERLAKMVRQQAQEAQFIVVSLRRPTIESADRVIGVTQARGAHTQVLGIAL